MAETFVQLDADGSGKKLHTFDRSVSGQVVHDEVVLLGQPIEATFSTIIDNGDVGTANRHLFELINGATKIVRLRRLWVAQATAASSASRVVLDLYRLSTTGTGGSAATINPYDTTDTSAVSALNRVVTTPGTTTNFLWRWELSFGASLPFPELSQFDHRWDVLSMKPILVPTSGRVGLRIGTAAASAAAISVGLEWTESSY